MTSMSRERLIAVGALALAVGVVVALFVVYLDRGFVPGDAYTYLGAGERLNAGHPLYSISPGDRPIAPEPPFWTVPLLSPPPIAVLWRPLAVLPNDLGVYLWWALDTAAIVVALGLMLARRPVLVSAAILACSIPLVYEIGVGNMNGLVLLGTVLVWRATAMREERVAGAVSGVLAAFKLTPAILCWWLLTGARWRAVRWAIGAGLIVLGMSLLGAGLDAHLRFLDVIGETASGGARPLSLAGIALYLGVPAAVANALPTAALVAGVALVAALRRRPDLAFTVVVVTMVIGSPTVSINWFVYLLAGLAPLAWPLARAEDGMPAARMAIDARDPVRV